MSLSVRLSLLLLVSAAPLAAEPLPEGAIARLGSAGLRDELYPMQAVFSADGKTLRTTNGGSVVVWDVVAGKRLRRVAVKTLPGVGGSICFTPDGKSLLIGGFDGVIHFFDTDTGAEQKTLASGRPGHVQGLQTSRDGKTLLSIHPTNLIVWDVDAGKPRAEIEKSEQLRRLSSWPIVLTPDGKQIVLPNKDGLPSAIETATGKEMRTFELPPAPAHRGKLNRIHRLVLSPDGRYLAVSTHYAAPPIVYELATGQRICQLGNDLNANSINGMAFTPNGRFLAVSSFQSTRLFGVLSGKEVRRLPMISGPNHSLLFAPGGRTLAVLGPGFIVHLWDVIAGRELHPPDGHRTAVQSLVFLGDGRRLASWTHGDPLLVWDIPTEREIARHDGQIVQHSLALADDGRSLRFLTYPLPGWSVQRWDPATDRCDERSLVVPQLSIVNFLVLAPDGHSVALLTRERKIYLLDVKNTKPRLLVQTSRPHTLWDFTPNSRLLLTSDFADHTLHLWECTRGNAVRQLKLDSSGAVLLSRRAFAADGRSMAISVQSGSQLRLHEIATGGTRLTLAVRGVRTLAVSPNGRLLALGQPDGAVVVFGTGTGKELIARRGAQGPISSLAFSRDSRLLASGGGNGTILVWKLPEGEGLPAILTVEETARLWQNLADRDAGRANRALAGLVAAPAQAIPLIEERFSVAPRQRTAKEIARLIADLDADAFKVRERATRELAEAGPDAADALHKALVDNPSAEAKKRIDDLLNLLSKGGDPERLRGLRAIEVLERIGTPQAKDALRELGRKPLSAELREEIEASLRRIEVRQPGTPPRTRTP